MIPGAQILPNIPVAQAEQICRGLTEDDLHADCVFDVVTTGDETSAQGYLLAQDLRLHGSTVQISGDKESTRPGESLVITATVSSISSGRPTPTGSVTFLVDGVAVGPPVKLDKQGRARFTTNSLDDGTHKIRAAYEQKTLGCLFKIFAIFGGRKYSYHSSTSPNLLHTVGNTARHAMSDTDR